MKVIGIIPARYNSSRFPGKPLALIHGKSMIQLVYEQAKKVSAFSEIIIATDNKEIFDHVHAFGANVMYTSEHHQSGTDRCGEVINTLTEDFDIAVNIQGDEPFIQPEQLEKLITAFGNSEVEIATLAIQIKDSEKIFDSNCVKVVFSEQNKALYFSRNPIPFTRNFEPAQWHNITPYFKHLGIYAFRTNALKQLVTLSQTPLEQAESLEQLRWLENGFTIHIIETNIDTIGIDTKEDLEKI